MKVTIVSPEKILFDGEAAAVKLPGEKGRFEVLEHHAPIISTLVQGRISCEGENPFEMDIQGGFVEISRNVVSICVEV
ncbi:MAG: F0F1 ATP synthase subunit epsilon [Prevotellamassilia sp.]